MDTVFIFSSVDFEQVQRHTLRYYHSEYCSDQFDTHVVTPSSKLPGVTNHHFHFNGIIGVIFMNVVFAPLWAWLFITEDPDVVHCHPETVTPPLLARMITGAHIVSIVVSEPFEQREEFLAEKDQSLSLPKRYLYFIDRVLFGFILRRSDLVVPLSGDLADKIVRNYRVNPESIYIVPLGVDVSKFEPRPDSHGAALSMVYIGTINEMRGLDTLVEALGRLNPETRSGLRFDLIGGGDDQYVEELVSSITETVPEVTFEYHGFVDHEDIPQLAGRSDVSISLLPGLESYNVSSPAKVFEYLALGLPVIATDIPAHRRILTDGEDSIIVGQNDPEAVARAIETLLGDPDRVDQMSETARSSAMESSWEQRFSGLYDHIRTL